MSLIGTDSGDDIGDVRIGDPRDQILQPELALLEAGEFELIASDLRRQSGNLNVELPVICPQGLEIGDRLIIVHRHGLALRHLRRARNGP